MGTRAVYTFLDDRGTHHVYKHWDGYPEGALQFISFAKEKAWPLPRYEADEFATAFISANKEASGDLRLTEHWNKHGDLEYRYEVRCRSNDKDLHVIIYQVGFGSENSKVMDQGYLCDLMKKYVKKRA
jgi:hypothetical protein